MRAFATLLLEEVEHHAPSLIAGGVLGLTTLSLFWFGSLQRALPTVMMAASGFVYYLVPFYVFFVVNRLVVQDRDAGTHVFLAGLPLSPGLRFGVQYLVGATAVTTLVTVALVGTALLAAAREGLPANWVLQLFGQLQLYALAWFAVDFAIAHLGRFRILLWWLMFAFAAVFDANGIGTWGEVLWHAILFAPIDQTRAAPPTVEVVIAVAWIVGGTVLGAWLATFRSGSIPDRLFRPETSRSSGLQFLVGLIVPLLLEIVVDAALVDTEDAWSTLSNTPVAGVDLRVAAPEGSALWRVAEDAATDLATLAERTGVGPFPAVVVVAGAAEDLDEVRLAPGADRDRSLILVVDVDHDHGDLVRQVVYRTLQHHSGSLTGWNTDTDWLIRGVPGWLRPDPLLQARAAGGAPVRPYVPDWLRMEIEVGEDVAEGVAWSVVDEMEDAQVIALLQHLLGRRMRRPTLFNAWWLRDHLGEDWVRTVAGADLATLWHEALDRRISSDPRVPHDDFGLVLESRGEGLVARWSEPLPADAYLRWRRMDPMAAHPGFGEDVELVRIEDPDTRELVVPVDPDARAAAELVWVDDTIAGVRTTGWRARW